MLHAWLSARSVARQLPPPVLEHGGYRVDTGTADEVARWVFPQVNDGLSYLARSIKEPRHLLKVCGTAEELRAVLPKRWRVHAPGYFMQSGTEWTGAPVPGGYTTALERNGAVAQVRIRSSAGELAASGYAAETPEAFVYDRIVTEPAHRRRGLARAVMAALRSTKQCRHTPELLVATEDGRALYAALGWRTVSPYSTASIAESSKSSRIASPPDHPRAVVRPSSADGRTVP